MNNPDLEKQAISIDSIWNATPEKWKAFEKRMEYWAHLWRDLRSQISEDQNEPDST
jgi:hypothetical protein